MADRNLIFDHQQESSSDSEADVAFVIEVSSYFDWYSGITGKTIGEYKEFPPPLRKHQKVSEHFKSKFPYAIIPRISVISNLLTHSVFRSSHFNQICLNFQSIIIT